MCIRPSRLTSLHVVQQVPAVLLGLLNLALQLLSFDRREQRALFAVRQEVGHLGHQVIQDMLSVRWRLTTNLRDETQREKVSATEEEKHNRHY